MVSIRELFNRALEALPPEREALLAGLPAGIRSEVLSLLQAHESAGAFLGGSDGSYEGKNLGPYRLLERIGEGGMGEVYRAVRDDGEFQKEVAIKVVAGRLMAYEAERRFIAERRILACLDHPNIVRMIDGGVDRGCRYLVMELISGLPIPEHCARNRLPVAERLRLFQSFCSAIQHAHKNLILHGDLKPGNILVDAEGQVKVLDFGIARLLGSESRNGPETTVLHPFTLSCASPEQVREERLTLASDIYSLGLLLYQLLSGENPQTGGTRAEILHRIVASDPAPPSRLARGISPDLDAIALKAMHKEPSRRYASAAEMSADIGRFLESRPVLARSPSRWYHAARFCTRNKALTAVALALIVAVAGGVLATVAESRRSARRFEEVRGLAHSLMFEVYDSISALPGSTAARHLVVDRARQYLDGLAREVGTESALRRELAEAYLRIGDVQGRPYLANLGDTAGALESYRKGQALLESESARHPLDEVLQDKLCDAHMNVGVILMRQGDAEGSMTAARRAIALAEVLNTRHPRSAVYSEKLSHAYMRLGQAQYVAAERSGSLPASLEVLATYETALKVLMVSRPHSEKPWRERLASTYFYVGYALRHLGNLTGDASYYCRALESAVQGDAIKVEMAVATPDPPALRRLAGGKADLGIFRWKCSADLSGAMQDMRAALAGFEENAARDPLNLEAKRDVAGAHQNIGSILGDAGHNREALQENRIALAMYEEFARGDPSSREDKGYIAVLRARIAILAANAKKAE